MFLAKVRLVWFNLTHLALDYLRLSLKKRHFPCHILLFSISKKALNYKGYYFLLTKVLNIQLISFVAWIFSKICFVFETYLIVLLILFINLSFGLWNLFVSNKNLQFLYKLVQSFWVHCLFSGQFKTTCLSQVCHTCNQSIGLRLRIHVVALICIFKEEMCLCLIHWASISTS